LNESHRVYFKNYFCFKNDRTSSHRGGGTLIVCKENLDPIHYPDSPNSFKGCEFTLVSIKVSQSDSNRILIASIYKPSEIRFSLRDWSDLFDCFVNLGSFNAILITGDLNAQYRGWGSTKNNFAGITLNDYLISFYYS